MTVTLSLIDPVNRVVLRRFDGLSNVTLSHRRIELADGTVIVRRFNGDLAIGDEVIFAQSILESPTGLLVTLSGGWGLPGDENPDVTFRCARAELRRRSGGELFLDDAAEPVAYDDDEARGFVTYEDALGFDRVVISAA